LREYSHRYLAINRKVLFVAASVMEVSSFPPQLMHAKLKKYAMQFSPYKYFSYLRHKSFTGIQQR
jgi:hypothetical protein